MKITNKIRKPLSKITHSVSTVRHNSLTDALNIIEKEGLEPLGLELQNEDGTPFGAIFCGEEGTAYIRFGNAEEMVDNSLLVYYWHKLSNNRWEINAYFS